MSFTSDTLIVVLYKDDMLNALLFSLFLLILVAFSRLQRCVLISRPDDSAWGWPGGVMFVACPMCSARIAGVPVSLTPLKSKPFT